MTRLGFSLGANPRALHRDLGTISAITHALAHTFRSSIAVNANHATGGPQVNERKITADTSKRSKQNDTANVKHLQ